MIKIKKGKKNNKNIKENNNKNTLNKNVQDKNVQDKNIKDKNIKDKNIKDKNLPEKHIKKQKRKKPIWKILLLIFLCLFIIGMLAMGAFFLYIIKTAPEFSAAKLYETQMSILFDKDGNEFARVGGENREIITYDQLPEVLVDAIVATEDARFFQHNGFDLPRFTVATIKQLLGNSSAGGASTLTMQISKNKVTSSVDEGFAGIKRKFQDIYISIFKIEKFYTKQEIIEFYVNSNYLGGSSYGVETASQEYFGKSAKDLTLPEAAMITGIFNAPNYYDPFLNPENCESRRQDVLYLMKRHGYISNEEYESAMKMTVDKLLNTSESNDIDDYRGFVNTVVEEVFARTGKDPYSTPLKIYTTMDADKQEYVEKVFRGEISSYKWENDVAQAGVAVIDSNNGSIAAIGAGRNRNARDYNYATSISNQIGSTAKPLYDYGPAIEYLGWGSGTIIIDESWNYTGTNIYINNWDSRFSGFASVREAIIDSKNIPALKTFQSVPNSKIYNYVKSLGLHPEASGNTLHESHSLGGYNGESPLSIAAAYAVYSNGGYYIEPYSFTKVEYIETGDVYTYKPTKKRVVSEETAYIITNILIDTARTYSNNYINGVTYAAKSGTTNLTKETIQQNNLPYNAVSDLWLSGYNGKYAISVWYGYDYLSNKTCNTFGSQQNTRLFQAIAKGIFTTSLRPTRPSGVVEVVMEDDTNLLASEFTPNSLKHTELYKKGTEPTEVSTRFSRLSDVTNLNAEVNGNTVVLTWDKVATPEAIDEEYLNKYFNRLFRDKTTMNKYLQQRINYNKKSIGTITYDIYEKDAEGNLNLITTTEDNTATIEATNTDNTYIVKTSYTIFKDNASNGKEISVTATIEEDKIEAILTKNVITINLNSEFVFDHEWIQILENDVEIDKTLASISVDTSNVDTTTVGEYNVLINIKYNDYENTLVQIVKVTE